MRTLFLVLFFGVWIVSGCSGLFPIQDKTGQPARCDDVVGRGHLNVLTINLLFSETETRDARLDTIADFVSNTPVDVVLLQEVAGGVLVGTSNSALDLQGKLRDRESNYDLHTAPETGVPGLLEVANAVLTRCEIDFKMVKRLPKTSELEFKNHDIKLPRNVMMTRLNVPEFGNLNIYNTHLCAKCNADEMDGQLQALLAFIDSAETFFPQTNPVILGGDFNIDRFRVDPFEERVFYDAIIDTGLIDAYAVNRSLADLCENPELADEHCTVGVSTLDEGDSARRIDYLFVKNTNVVLQSKVVFNDLVDEDQPGASDHAGVFISIKLP